MVIEIEDPQTEALIERLALMTGMSPFMPLLFVGSDFAQTDIEAA